MAYGFHAEFVDADDLVARLSFSDRDDETSEHYFIMDRSEDSPEETVPNMGNVYIERDDQCWGRFGGIDRVILERNCLTLQLEPRMADQMGGHNAIRITFDLGDSGFYKQLGSGTGGRLRSSSAPTRAASEPVQGPDQGTQRLALSRRSPAAAQGGREGHGRVHVRRRRVCMHTASAQHEVGTRCVMSYLSNEMRTHPAVPFCARRKARGSCPGPVGCPQLENQRIPT
jgi:Immunity protein 10